MAKKGKQATSDYGAGGVALAGCLIGGMGIGWLVSPNLILQGTIVGLGVGLIVMALMTRSGGE